jgi:nitrate/TMAO reductase-like tetraheme cytochrome c subunit
MKQRLPSSVYNPVTLTGAAISAVSFGIILFLMLLELLGEEHKPYVGILAFVVLPAVLIFGLLLIAYGIYRESRRIKKGITRDKFPVLNLNDPKHRAAVALFSVITILLLLFTAFGSFKAYEYTDSDEFCGTVCHTVMEPEYTAYKHSPHAKVGCVSCHIGPGAGWFVRSKLSGAYQVYSVMFDKYPRPIPTPIENLRPARETCEQCHWPSHFFSEKKVDNVYYLSDENNSRWSLSLLMKIGGGNEEAGNTSGIHWHMNIANKITYYATDRTRMVIPWVKAVSKNGKETIYRSTKINFDEKKLTEDDLRVMDCIDCHNRPSHIYHPPMRSVNHVMAQDWINSELPFIKSVSIQALERTYRKKSIALDSIKLFVNDFYESNYPEIAAGKKGEIEQAVKQLRKIYSRNYFPEMKVSWREFPEQIGHMYSPGCFRCHDGNHVSDDGKIISNDCNVCHTLLAQSFEGNEQVSMKGVDYIHPVDVGGSWKDSDCSTCHTRKRTY